MAQTPAELRPFQSPRHYLGAELRAWRLLRGLSLAQLGRMVHASGDLLGKVEKAQRWPTEDLIRRCDSTLNAAGTLMRLHVLVGAGAHTPTHGAEPRTADLPKLANRVGHADGAALPEPDTGVHSSANIVSLAEYRRRKLATVS